MAIEDWSPQRRILVFILVTIAFFLIYGEIMRWLAPTPPKPQRPPPVQPTVSKPVPRPEPIETPAPWPSEPIEAARAETFRIETNVYSITWTNVGAVALSWRLRRYSDLQGQPLEMIPQYLSAWRPLRLVDNQGRPLAHLDRARYRVTRRREVDGSVELTFEYADTQNWVRKRLRFPPNGYGVDVEIWYRRRGGQNQPVYVVWAPGVEHSTPRERKAAGWSFRAIRGLYWTGKLHGVGHKKEGYQVLRNLHARWLGLHSNFFLVAFVAPSNGTFQQALFSTRMLVAPANDPWPEERPREFEENHDILMSVGIPLTDGRPQRWTLFVGPKDPAVLAQVDASLAESVQYGWFAFIAKPLLALLKFCYAHIVPNYGVAIILVTLLIRVLLWPLSHKMFVSSERMKAIQPKIKAIQEKYKGIPLRDPRRRKMNEELMRIYKEHGVNPMSGCLPLLLQLPILIAFYNLLAVAIELRQAPFVLWIQDLSRPDPFLITPLLMGFTMILQQKLSPTTLDPNQQRIGYVMAVVFTFMFANAQSGLVLYWLFSNVFSMVQQQLYHRVLLKRVQPVPARRRLKPAQR